jgi:hypothetical protein
VMTLNKNSQYIEHLCWVRACRRSRRGSSCAPFTP